MGTKKIHVSLISGIYQWTQMLEWVKTVFPMSFKTKSGYKHQYFT